MLVGLFVLCNVPCQIGVCDRNCGYIPLTSSLLHYMLAIASYTMSASTGINGIGRVAIDIIAARASHVSRSRTIHQYHFLPDMHVRVFIGFHARCCTGHHLPSIASLVFW
jgi:hypothetical protein